MGRWDPGQPIVRREVLGLGPRVHLDPQPWWHGKPWEGIPVQDFELDFVVSPDGSYVIKDADVLDDRVSEGRFTAELVDWVRQLGAQVAEELDAGHHWWDPSWSGWKPPSEWPSLRLPEGWAEAPCPSI